MHTAGILDQEDDSFLDSPSAQAISEFLTILEDTESPRLFLTWSLLSTVAGLIGKNAVFRSGPLHTVKSNLFVVLLGPPGVRKSTAINQTIGFAEGLSLNLGPTDTGGQRHGLMSALAGMHRPWQPRLEGPANFSPNMDTSHIAPMNLGHMYSRDSADMMLVAPELSRLMGLGNHEMADFFNDLYDGAVVNYQTKITELKIREPNVTLLGATTPASLAQILHSAAAGHGILSRILFVYADSKHKEVPIPPEPSEGWYESKRRFKQRLVWVDNNRRDFTLDSSGDAAYRSLYAYVPILDEPRLEFYRERRASNLLKVAMSLAALAMTTRIDGDMIKLAHHLLTAIEPNMRKALEFFGRNKVYVGRMLILQFIKNAEGQVVDMREAISAASSELTQREAQDAIQAMISSGELLQNVSGQLTLGESKNATLTANLKTTRKVSR